MTQRCTIEPNARLYGLGPRLASTTEIQKWIVRNHGFVPESAWIEDCKHRYGVPTNQPLPLNPCPPDRRAAIKQAFEHFRMLP